ncbi:protein FAM90A27P-like [Sus scrofa]|uniref:protein FAM90A27P-like n=1 Tax=Sus scrofa TaxID=9823 RepID=UPI000A2B370A|nr:protein FAM90A27P-like [Sus scrofa]
MNHVKCRDCGAFGHKASSVRCPMKRWQGALAPQPLGCRLGKENLEPRKLQVLQTLRTCNLAERDKEQRPRQAGHQLKLLQRLPGRPQEQQWCWKEVTESCDYVRHPHRPMLIQPPKRKSLLELEQPSRPPVRKDDPNSTQPLVALGRKSLLQHPRSSIQAPGKRSAQSSIQPCLHPQKKPRLSPARTPWKNLLTSNLGAFQHLQLNRTTTGCGTTVKPHVTRKTPAQLPSPAPQPPLGRSVSNTIQACTPAQPQPTSLVPGQPLRMLFRRVGKGWWNCRYMGPPLRPPAEKPAPLALSPPDCSEPECPHTPGSWSVLHEDLQVSSSSEESDSEEDTHGQMPPPC